MLTENDKRTIREQVSYRVAVRAARLALSGVVVLCGVTLLNAATRPPAALYEIGLFGCGTVIFSSLFTLLVADARITALRYRLRGYKLFDSAGRTQYYVMFYGNVFCFWKPIR